MRDGAQAAGLTVLVVDDDELMRELLPAILAADGHSAHAVATGIEALHWLGTEPVDVVLADLHMPGLEGAELAGRLNEARQPATLLIGMSGSTPKASERALFDAFLHKPFGLEDFRRAVDDGEARGITNKGAPSHGPVLDESIYRRLAAMLPPAKLKELYGATTRTSADARRMRSRAAAVWWALWSSQRWLRASRQVPWWTPPCLQNSLYPAHACSVC